MLASACLGPVCIYHQGVAGECARGSLEAYLIAEECCCLLEHGAVEPWIEGVEPRISDVVCGHDRRTRVRLGHGHEAAADGGRVSRILPRLPWRDAELRQGQSHKAYSGDPISYPA